MSHWSFKWLFVRWFRVQDRMGNKSSSIRNSPKATPSFIEPITQYMTWKSKKKTSTLRIEKFIFEQTSGFAMSVPVWRVNNITMRESRWWLNLQLNCFCMWVFKGDISLIQASEFDINNCTPIEATQVRWLGQWSLMVSFMKTFHTSFHLLQLNNFTPYKQGALSKH